MRGEDAVAGAGPMGWCMRDGGSKDRPWGRVQSLFTRDHTHRINFREGAAFPFFKKNTVPRAADPPASPHRTTEQPVCKARRGNRPADFHELIKSTEKQQMKIQTLESSHSGYIPPFLQASASPRTT